MRFTETNPHAQRLLEACPMSFAVSARDLCHPTRVLLNGAALVGTADPEAVECAPAAALDRISAFLEIERRKLRDSTVKESARSAAQTAAVVAQVAAGASAADARETYQRKIEPWKPCCTAVMRDEERLMHALGCAVDALSPQGHEVCNSSGICEDHDEAGRAHKLA